MARASMALIRNRLKWWHLQLTPTAYCTLAMAINIDRHTQIHSHSLTHILSHTHIDMPGGHCIKITLTICYNMRVFYFYCCMFYSYFMRRLLLSHAKHKHTLTRTHTHTHFAHMLPHMEQEAGSACCIEKRNKNA